MGRSGGVGRDGGGEYGIHPGAGWAPPKRGLGGRRWGGGPLAAPVWTPPGDVERRLADARAALDWAGYLDALAETYLFHADTRAYVDAHPGSVRLTGWWRPEVRERCVAVFTQGMLPPPEPDPVFFSKHLRWYANTWERQDPPWLAVNPGTPAEAYLRTTPAHRALWQRHCEQAAEPAEFRLHTLWAGAPRTGPLAHGLACGALLNVRNDDYWNALGHENGYRQAREMLDEWWDDTTAEQWRETTERLLRGDMTSPLWEFTLRIRRELAGAAGRPVPAEAWREAAKAEVRRRFAGRDGRDDDEDEDQEGGGGGAVEVCESVRRLVGRVTRYEARFRADGLLPADGFVRSVAAWDPGRVPNVVRMGLAARYCTPAEAQDAIVRAGRVNAVDHRTWEEFAASFVLGRCLHFDGEEFGKWYTESVAAYRVLTSDPASPWRTLPFR